MAFFVEGAKWCDILAPMSALMERFTFVRKMLAPCEPIFQHEYIRQFVADKIASFPLAIIERAYNQAVSECIKEACDCGAKESLTCSRVVGFEVAGFPFEAPIVGVESEVRNLWAAWLRSELLGHQLPLLPHQGLETLRIRAQPRECEEVVYRKIRAARHVWQQAFERKPATCNSAEGALDLIQDCKNLWKPMESSIA